MTDAMAALLLLEPQPAAENCVVGGLRLRTARLRPQFMRQPRILEQLTSGRPVLVVALGDKRVDEKKAAAAIGEKIGRAKADFVREATALPSAAYRPLSRAAADRADR